MEEVVTLKLETYTNLVNRINALKRDLKCALNGADQEKEKLNKLTKTLIEETKYCDFDGATVEEIKSKNPSGYIYCSTYRSLINFYTDDELKDFLLEIKKEQKDEEDS